MGIASWLGRTIRLTDGDFWKGFFGLGTHSGETVTTEKALQLDAAWACIKLNSETVGTLPCVVYEQDGSTVAVDNPLYELLHDAPNADDTAVEFWEGVVLSLMLWGNYVAEIVRSGGRIVAIMPIKAECVTIERAEDGSRRYVINEEGKTRNLAEENVFHVRGLRKPGHDLGMSPIAYARQTLGNAMAAEKTAGKMFSNGMQTAGVLTSGTVLKPEQRKQISSMMLEYAGSDKAGKIMILEAGFDYKQLSLTPEDAQMLATRQFGIEQICRWFGVPPIMIGHASQGQTMWGSGVEQLILQFSKTGLRPILKRIEGAIRRDLLTIEQRKTLKVEFNMEGLLRGDSAARAAFYSTMVQNGIMTRNEARKLENRPPMDGADMLTAQTNLAPLDKLGSTIGGAQVQVGAAMAALIEGSVEQAVAKALAKQPAEKR
jgi:HK97 family phage portal protein